MQRRERERERTTMSARIPGISKRQEEEDVLTFVQNRKREREREKKERGKCGESM